MIIDQRPIEAVRPYPNNPRNNKKAVAAVAASIKEFGFKVPIVVDTAGVIITGHTRREAALSLGMKTVPVIVADDLTEAQIRAFRLADNKVSEFSEWDEDALAEELAQLDEAALASNPTSPRPELGGKTFYDVTGGKSDFAAYVKAAGATILEGYQLRYIYFIDKRARARLTVPEIPFSEIDRVGAGMYKGQKIPISERHISEYCQRAE